jgi:glucose uptake protein
MILPASTLATLLLLVVAFFCWGSWANTQKSLPKWRFELFYYDFALGIGICALIATYTLGSLNTQELTVSDNMMLAGYRRMAYGVAAGVVVNLANVLLVAAISQSGMAVTFPLSFGIGLIVMSLTSFFGNSAPNNAPLLFSGLVLIFLAVLTNIFAYRSHLDALATASKSGPMLDPRTRLPVRPPSANKGIILAIVSGLVGGFFFPLIDSGRFGDNGVGPYGMGGLIGLGAFASTLLYVPFFLNFPVRGEPVQARNYFKGTRKQHLWGMLGGAVWITGTIAALVAAAVPAAVQVPPAVGAALLYGAPILAALWGILRWHEFKDAPSSVNMLLLGMFVLFAAGVGLISIAPAYAPK